MTNLTETFTVFEIVNDRLQEIYVGHTAGPVFQVVGVLRQLSVPALKHWDLADAQPVRSIEFGLSETDARRYISNYLQRDLPPGWRFLSGA